MHIPHDKAEKISNPNLTIWDYMVSPEVGVSYQELTARGPAQGRYLNKKCHEIYFIIAGNATFDVDGEIIEVQAKDLVIIPENTPHSIETSDLKYITITRPDWYEEQYEEVK